MRLKSQRQILAGGVVTLAAVATALGGVLWQDRNSPDIVKLGKGIASIETQPASDVPSLSSSAAEEVAADGPAPVASENAMGGGEASYYGTELAGNRTASGESFDPNQLTAAHRTLPLGSRVRVTNARNGDSVVVRINDRGPYHGNRVIDLSTAAARTIGLIASGTGQVRLALLVT